MDLYLHSCDKLTQIYRVATHSFLAPPPPPPPQEGGGDSICFLMISEGTNLGGIIFISIQLAKRVTVVSYYHLPHDGGVYSCIPKSMTQRGMIDNTERLYALLW